MKKTLSIFIVLFCFFSFTILCFAHSGGTDSEGGHYVSGSGEYHYHHGYSAHQHPDGLCPYNFSDKANHNSSNSSKNDWPKIEKEETTSNILESVDDLYMPQKNFSEYLEEHHSKQETTSYKSFDDYANERFNSQKNETTESDEITTTNNSINSSDNSAFNKYSYNSFNSFIYNFRTITWPLVISFFITIALMFVIYGIYQMITSNYMTDKTASIVSIIIFCIIAAFIFKGFTDNNVVDYYNSYSFSSFDLFDIVIILVHLAFAFFGSGVIMAILSEITPLFDEKRYKSKRIYSFVLIVIFIILFIVLFDVAQYFNLFTQK